MFMFIKYLHSRDDIIELSLHFEILLIVLLNMTSTETRNKAQKAV